MTPSGPDDDKGDDDIVWLANSNEDVPGPSQTNHVTIEDSDIVTRHVEVKNGVQILYYMFTKRSGERSRVDRAAMTNKEFTWVERHSRKDSRPQPNEAEVITLDDDEDSDLEDEDSDTSPDLTFASHEEYNAFVDALKQLTSFDDRLQEYGKEYKDSSDNELWHRLYVQNKTAKPTSDGDSEEAQMWRRNETPLWRMITEGGCNLPFTKKTDTVYWPLFDPVDSVDLYSESWENVAVNNVLPDNSHDAARLRKSFLVLPPVESHAARVARLLKADESGSPVALKKRFSSRYGCRRAFARESHEARKQIDDSENALERSAYQSSVSSATSRTIREELKKKTNDAFSISQKDMAPGSWYGPEARHLLSENNNKDYFKKCMDKLEQREKEEASKITETDFDIFKLELAMCTSFVGSGTLLTLLDDGYCSKACSLFKNELAELVRGERRSSPSATTTTVDKLATKLRSSCRPSAHMSPDHIYLDDHKEALVREDTFELLVDVHTGKNNRKCPNGLAGLEKGLTADALLHLCRLREWEVADWNIIYQMLVRYFPMYVPVSCWNLREQIDLVFRETFAIPAFRIDYFNRFTDKMKKQKATTERNMARSGRNENVERKKPILTIPSFHNMLDQQRRCNAPYPSAAPQFQQPSLLASYDENGNTNQGNPIPRVESTWRAPRPQTTTGPIRQTRLVYQANPTQRGLPGYDY